MGRDFQINGEALVSVKFGDHALLWTGPEQPPASPFFLPFPGATNSPFELGLASDKISISPTFKHQDIHIDDFGPDIPAEVLWMQADVTIKMTLIHYNPNILDFCIRESMGGMFGDVHLGKSTPAGTLAPAGTPMGGGYAVTWPDGSKAVLSSGCHYMQLGLASPVLNAPYRFRSAYLADKPVEIPLGVHVTAAVCSWRAIPYVPLSLTYAAGASLGDLALRGQAGIIVSGQTYLAGANEIVSSGAVVWDRQDLT